MRVSHIALYAEDLRAAENFYARVFAAELLFREAVDGDGVWHTLPLSAGWDDATAVGIRVDLVVLRRDDLVLPVFAGRSSPRIIGLDVAAEEIEAMRARLPDEAHVLAEGEARLVFVDPFGVQWQVSAAAAFRSSGEIHGRWLPL